MFKRKIVDGPGFFFNVGEEMGNDVVSYTSKTDPLVFLLPTLPLNLIRFYKLMGFQRRKNKKEILDLQRSFVSCPGTSAALIFLSLKFVSITKIIGGGLEQTKQAH